MHTINLSGFIQTNKPQEVEKAYTEGTYSDTPANKKLGRVGMTYKQYELSKNSKVESKEEKSEPSITTDKFSQTWHKDIEDLFPKNKTGIYKLGTEDGSLVLYNNSRGAVDVNDHLFAKIVAKSQQLGLDVKLTGKGKMWSLTVKPKEVKIGSKEYYNLNKEEVDKYMKSQNVQVDSELYNQLTGKSPISSDYANRYNNREEIDKMRKLNSPKEKVENKLAVYKKVPEVYIDEDTGEEINHYKWELTDVGIEVYNNGIDEKIEPERLKLNKIGEERQKAYNKYLDSDNVADLRNELKDLQYTRKQLLIDMEEDIANTSEKHKDKIGNEYGKRLEKVEKDINKLIDYIPKRQKEVDKIYDIFSDTDTKWAKAQEKYDKLLKDYNKDFDKKYKDEKPFISYKIEADPKLLKEYDYNLEQAAKEAVDDAFNPSNKGKSDIIFPHLQKVIKKAGLNPDGDGGPLFVSFAAKFDDYFKEYRQKIYDEVDNDK